MKYRKKPNPVVAHRIGHGTWPAELQACVGRGMIIVEHDGNDAIIGTPEGLQRCERGDWVLLAADGSLSRCYNLMFETMYEPDA